MHILHTEASPGWGGQEIRILREAEGMRERGHEIIFAIQKGGGLAEAARKAGFVVYEFPMRWAKLFGSIVAFGRIITRHKIDVVNTHSSYDAWVAGATAKALGCRVVRTRHLSTAIKKGLNSVLLYRFLADAVVTTCEHAAERIRKQANISHTRCRSVPTGIDPRRLDVDMEDVEAFRKKHKIHDDDIVVGTTCIMRGWKGISDMLQAAKMLQHIKNLKWVIVGSGVSEAVFHNQCQDLGLEGTVTFTGYVDCPKNAIAAMDIFTLLSTANEGVSQATLQAGYLHKPLVTTSVGGLGEVCIDGKTGFIVPKNDPKSVADRIMTLYSDSSMRQRMGDCSHTYIMQQFSFDGMLDRMEEAYRGDSLS